MGGAFQHWVEGKCDRVSVCESRPTCIILPGAVRTWGMGVIVTKYSWNTSSLSAMKAGMPISRDGWMLVGALAGLHDMTLSRKHDMALSRKGMTHSKVPA